VPRAEAIPQVRPEPANWGMEPGDRIWLAWHD
jgi:hypothetical protein